MELKLYVVPSSHPCRTVEAALALKRLHYERVDLFPGASQMLQRVRFGRRTVPGLEVDGMRVSGSRLILRTLDGLRPDPPLYPPPGTPESEAVEEAERWGDEVLQTAARWIAIYAVLQRPRSGESFIAGSNLPRFPAAITAQTTRAIFGLELRVLAGGPAGARRWLEDLPGLLDHADALIDSGVIGGESPGAADLQIGASVRLLLNVADLRGEIEPRPCGRLARRLFPDYPGEVPAGAL